MILTVRPTFVIHREPGAFTVKRGDMAEQQNMA
jgi:hypothetical protein